MSQFLKLVIIGGFALVLTACQTAPNPLILSPQIAAGQILRTPVQLSVKDARPQQALLSIRTSGDEVIQGSSEPSVALAVEDALRQQLNILNSSETQLNVVIDEAKVNVKQGPVRYEATYEIALRAELLTRDNGATETYRKRFTGSASDEGALRAKEADLESEFNELLSELLSNLLADENIRSALSR